MKCAAHSGRGRAPKDCAACHGVEVISAITPLIPPTRAIVELQAEAQEDHAAVAPVARKRKTYRVEYADEPKTPRTTEDGRTWLDADGNPPVEDANGLLLQAFKLQLVFGAVEQWGVGLRLPMPPTIFKEWAAEREAARARIHKGKTA